MPSTEHFNATSQKMKLPKTVLSLDIETSAPFDKKRIMNNDLFLGGVAIFTLQKNKVYKFKKYRYFKPENIRQLKSVLTMPNSIIIGHNIYRFDLKVLSRYIPITKNIIDRSVDTLYVIAKARKYHTESIACVNGLSLASIVGGACGSYKLRNKKHLQDWMNKGNYEKVAHYNKNDCRTAFELWQRLLSLMFKSSDYYKRCLHVKCPHYNRSRYSFHYGQLFLDEQYIYFEPLRLKKCINGGVISYNYWKHRNEFLKKLPQKYSRLMSC